MANASSKSKKIILDITDLDEVNEVLRIHEYSGTSYYELSLSLGLLPRTIDVIKANNSQDVTRCLLECLKEWLKKADNVNGKGGPTWHALINALRSIGENTVAEGIDKEKHPACVMFAEYKSAQSILDALPSLALLLHKEGLIGEMFLPTTSQVLLNAVQKAVCINYLNLEKFASVLQKFPSTISAGDAILIKYENRFGIRQTVGEFVQIIPDCSEFTVMRGKYASVMFDVSHIIKEVPSLNDLQTYLRFLPAFSKASINHCQNKVDIVHLISEKCSLVNIAHLKNVINKFKIEQAKPVINEYKNDIEEFCKTITLRLSLDKFFSTPSRFKSETATFIVDKNVDECTLNDIRVLIKNAFQELSINVRVVVVTEGNSFTVTCSFPLVLSQSLIVNAHKNIQLLQENKVRKLTIGYCTVYSSASLSEVSSSQTIYTSTLEQIIVSLNAESLETGKELFQVDVQLPEEQLFDKTEKSTSIKNSVALKEKSNEKKASSDQLSKEKMPLLERSETRMNETLLIENGRLKSEIEALQKRLTSLSVQLADREMEIQKLKEITSVDVMADACQFTEIEALQLFQFSMTNEKAKGNPLVQKIQNDPRNIGVKLALFGQSIKKDPSFLSSLRDEYKRQKEIVDDKEKEEGTVEWYTQSVLLYSPSSNQCHEVISQLKETHKKIEIIKLSQVNFRILMLSILKKQKVKELCMQETPLTHDDLHFLYLYNKNSSLTKLILSDCGINDEGVHALCNDLYRNKVLSSLFLWKNPDITSSSAYALHKLLLENSSLSYLNLQLTSLTSDGVLQLMESLTLNTTLDTLVLDAKHETTCNSFVKYNIIRHKLLFAKSCI